MKKSEKIVEAEVVDKAFSEMTWEELLIRREALNGVIENLEAEKKILSDEFLYRLNEEKISGKVVGNWSISKSTRYSFDTTVDQAKELGAAEQKWVIDTATLKQLVQKGTQVPGTKKIEYVNVREVVKSTE